MEKILSLAFLTSFLLPALLHADKPQRFELAPFTSVVLPGQWTRSTIDHTFGPRTIHRLDRFKSNPITLEYYNFGFDALSSDDAKQFILDLSRPEQERRTGTLFEGLYNIKEMKTITRKDGKIFLVLTGQSKGSLRTGNVQIFLFETLRDLGPEEKPGTIGAALIFTANDLRAHQRDMMRAVESLRVQKE